MLSVSGQAANDHEVLSVVAERLGWQDLASSHVSGRKICVAAAGAPKSIALFEINQCKPAGRPLDGKRQGWTSDKQRACLFNVYGTSTVRVVPVVVVVVVA